jgi:hypothetical protein
MNNIDGMPGEELPSTPCGQVKYQAGYINRPN